MKNAFFIAIIVAVLFLIIQSLKNIEYPKGLNSIQTEMVNSQQRRGSTPEIGAPSLSTQINDEKESAPENSLIEKSSDKNQSSSPEENEEGSLTPQGTLKYELDEDGLVTVDGDIVLGAIKDGASRGEIQVPEFQLWPNGRIPFFIQGDLKNPARIIRALAMFVDTPIQFVPYHEATGEEDVLVFETAKSGCKSYLGQIGGKQPVWISEECGVTEIAHELMHALGFIHEQNRTDRDSFIRVRWENIIESKKINFEVFPEIFMTVSGKIPFDFNSIMIYQPTSFTKNGLSTMVPVDPRQEIAPASGLSKADLIRIENVYRR